MTKKTKEKKKTLSGGADKATRWIGSISSLIFHTIVFVGAFCLPLFGVHFETVLLVLTTIVSLEAIYLAIFIQMTVNKNTADIEEIQEDVEDIQEDVDEIQEDVEEIQEDVAEIEKDVDEIQEDIEDIEEDAKIDDEADRKTEVMEIEALNKIQTILEELKNQIEKKK